MRASIIGGIFVAALMSTTAFSQSTNQGNSSAPAATAPVATTTTTTTKSTMSGHWRASKMMGLDIYNEQNEKLGDVNEILLDSTGKVAGYVIGVGGFLGMGEHDILVEPSKIKFVNEPARTAAASPAADNAATANASANKRATTTSRSTTEQWYPDHGVLSATKDQLKAMPAFKYTTSN
ncbi:MAG: PRC-barrel protein [Xanthobacteraceae bacterium]|nr:PRC-barrel protein [Xanthobacteraceae bacterium]